MLDNDFNGAYHAGIPRLVEALIALAGIIVFSPLLALSALAVAVSSKGPVFFRQERVGHNGKTFILYKFRTMRPGQGGPQVTASGDSRITPVGRILRKTKLDELPSLWNVLRGDMSIVGPRPEVPRYVDLNNPKWRMVLRVNPGITDPMTLCLRNEEALMADVPGDHETFYLDVLQPYKLEGYLDYIRQRSWRGDVAIVGKTLLAVISPGKTPPPTVEDIVDSNLRCTRRSA
jgi:lipopolysaccharide/colanic/teichoic acid biosynthesis glycosyltransferase